MKVYAGIGKFSGEDYWSAPRGKLTAKCHWYIIGDKSNKGVVIFLSSAEMGNAK
jgi:hypothetical protein